MEFFFLCIYSSSFIRTESIEAKDQILKNFKNGKLEICYNDWRIRGISSCISLTMNSGAGF
jgi:hypothetical protein